MNPENLLKLKDAVVLGATAIAFKVVAAFVFWVVGRWLIGVAVRFVRRALESQHVDPTLLRYAGSIINVSLNIVLVMGILGYFGVQTTTFAALFAAAGVAIGMAWSGLLAHFAAGAFLVVLRPFKTGDFVTIGGVTGTVREIGLFATGIDTPDNVFTVLGNNKVLSDTIVNYSANAYRRVELKAQLSGSADWKSVVRVLEAKLASIPNVLATPKPEISILEFNLVGPVLAVRPFCHTDHYWQVYFDANRVLKDDLAEFPAPMPAQTVTVRQVA
ncbi:MAG: mechanosensitive ion channel family protein [Polyangiaceae bacterium]